MRRQAPGAAQFSAEHRDGVGSVRSWMSSADDATGVALERLRAAGAAFTSLPADVCAHRVVRRVYEQRAAMVERGDAVDWAALVGDLRSALGDEERSADALEALGAAARDAPPPQAGLCAAAVDASASVLAEAPACGFHDDDAIAVGNRKRLYCVEAAFGASTVADVARTTTRCVTGLAYDGAPADVLPSLTDEWGSIWSTVTSGSAR